MRKRKPRKLSDYVVCFCKRVVDMVDVTKHIEKHLETDVEGVKIYVMQLTEEHTGRCVGHVLVRAFSRNGALAQTPRFRVGLLLPGPL